MLKARSIVANKLTSQLVAAVMAHSEAVRRIMAEHARADRDGLDFREFEREG